MSRLIRGTVKAPRVAVRLSITPSVARQAALCAIPLEVYADLLGRPFEANARGPESFDCVGLAVEMARRLGKQLPAFVSSEAELHAQLGAGGVTLADLPQIVKPEPGCIVLLRMSPSEHHIAFMVDEFRMIHTLKGVNCSIERVISQLWQRRVIGYYGLTVA